MYSLEEWQMTSKLVIWFIELFLSQFGSFHFNRLVILTVAGFLLHIFLAFYVIFLGLFSLFVLFFCLFHSLSLNDSSISVYNVSAFLSDSWYPDKFRIKKHYNHQKKCFKAYWFLSKSNKNYTKLLWNKINARNDS